MDYYPRLWPFRFLNWRDIVAANPSDVSYVKRLSELSAEQLLKSAKGAGIRQSLSVIVNHIIIFKWDSFSEIDAGTPQLILQSTPNCIQLA